MPLGDKGAIAFATLVTLVLDQLTKLWAVAELSDHNIDLFWTLRLNLVRNTGFAFSAGTGLGPWLSLLVPAIVIALWLFRHRLVGRFARISLGTLIGGAVGNLVDRLVRGRAWGRGGVVDFIDFQFWPVFNLADAAIVIGVIVITMNLYKSSEQDRDEMRHPDSA